MSNTSTETAEPELRECRDCGEEKELATSYAALPHGGYSPLCLQCQAGKAAETRRIRREGGTSKDWIIAELKENYRKSTKVGERIRVLETMAKLLTKEEASELDDAAVVKSLMDSMRLKKNAERREKRAAENTVKTDTTDG